MTRVGIVGSTGYAGAELTRIIAGHPDVSLSVITSRQFSGKRISDVYPSLEGFVDATCETFSIDVVCDNADVIFIALPHKIPMEIVPELLKKGKRVIDLSADFRFDDVARYEAAYQPHTAKDLFKKSVYGLSEVYKNKIENSDLIGNPGCYPTSILLPIVPFLREGLIKPDSIIADSKSGVSGAGRSLTIGSHFSEVNESFKAYKVASHRHTPEIEEIISNESKKNVHITFTPHLVPITRGMLSTIYSEITKPVTEKDLCDCLDHFYKESPFVRLCKNDRLPDVAHVRGTNFCDIAVRLDKNTNRLILISAIDNLMKGAASQAVQNMNIMLGLDEKNGIYNIPFPV